MGDGKRELWTVGHSNQECAPFVELLRKHAVTAVADVRSVPYSQYTAQFNRETLESVLARHAIKYVFMGKELGARREERECYVATSRAGGGMQARYELVRKLPAFEQGLERLRRGVSKERIALMCSEKDPLTCHRTILICRALRGEMEIRHILEDGGVETQAAAEGRLLKMMGLPEGDLFNDRAALIERAYEMQGEVIAYVEPAGEPKAVS